MRRVVAVITLLLGVTASADSEKAKQLSAEADALVASGDMIGAAAKFRAAYKEEPRPEHMCNSGVAYHKAKDLPRSHLYLNQCVSMGGSLDPAYRENLRKVVESIEQKLVTGDFTPIDIALEPPTAVLLIEGGKPYDEGIIGGGRIWLPYGEYRLLVRAPGFFDHRQELTATGHAAIPLRVALDQRGFEEKSRAQPIVVEKPGAVAAAGPSKLTAIAVTGLTGASAIAAILFYVSARDAAKDAEEAGAVEDYNDLHRKSHTHQRLSWELGALAGAGAIVSSVLWWRIMRTPERIEVTATGKGVAIRGRF